MTNPLKAEWNKSHRNPLNALTILLAQHTLFKDIKTLILKYIARLNSTPLENLEFLAPVLNKNAQVAVLAS